MSSDVFFARRISRRRLAQLAGVGAAAPLLQGLLAACGGDDDDEDPTATTASTSADPTATGADSGGDPTATTSGSGGDPTATTGDAGGDPTATSAPSGEGEPKRGGSLRAVLSSEPSSLSPLVARTTFDRTAMLTMLSNFFVYDEVYNPVPLLAASVEILPDLMTYEFVMRDDVLWHDGQPFSSADIMYTIQAIQDPNTPGAATQKRILTGATVEAPDELTLRMVMPAPNGAVLDIFTAVIVIREDYDETNPIGTGPFKFVEWSRNQRLVFERNEDYFIDGLPYLDEVVLLPTPDQEQAVNLLLTGEVDTIDQVALPRIEEVEGSDNAVVTFLSPEFNLPFYLFMLNNAKAPFDVAEVRQAINYAIDREALLEATFGYGSVRSNQVPTGHWAYNPDAPSYDTRDLDQARALMEQAGMADGFQTTLTYHLLADEFEQFGQIIQANLAEIGIDVELKLLEVGLWVDEVLRSMTFDMAMTWNVPGWDPDSLLGGWTRSDGASMGWAKTDEFEALLTQGAAAVEIEDRKPFYDDAQVLVFTDVPGAVINEKATMVASNTRIKGFNAQIRGHTEYEHVWIDE